MAGETQTASITISGLHTIYEQPTQENMNQQYPVFMFFQCPSTLPLSNEIQPGDK